MRFAAFAAIALALSACYPSAPAPEATAAVKRATGTGADPVGAAIDWLKNGKFRVVSNMCADIAGHYNIGYNGCNALVMLGNCVPAPGGTCICDGIPLQQDPECENITNGSGIWQLSE